MTVWWKLFLLAVGGASGAILRYMVSEWVTGLMGARFAWGTLTVNLAGCFLVGFGWVLAQEKGLLSPSLQLLLLSGFCGALTTFSTYIFETSQFVRGQAMVTAVANLFVSIIAGMAAFVIGSLLARWF